MENALLLTESVEGVELYVSHFVRDFFFFYNTHNVQFVRIFAIFVVRIACSYSINIVFNSIISMFPN